MKYLLVMVMVLVVCWLWRSSRQSHTMRSQHPAQPAPAEQKTTEMVACAVCDVHLPRSEALIGRDGFYCGDAHRRDAGA